MVRNEFLFLKTLYAAGVKGKRGGGGGGGGERKADPHHSLLSFLLLVQLFFESANGVSS